MTKKDNRQLPDTKIGVVGAGSWGTSIANHIGTRGYKVDLWAFEKDVCDEINSFRENKTFLPGFILSELIFPTNDLFHVVSDKDVVIMVAPSHVTRETAMRFSNYIAKDTIIVTASKGIENNTHLTMTGILKEIFLKTPEKNFAALSGPSFAREVAAKVPTAVTVASIDIETARFVQKIFSSPFFRVYTSDDVIGVEIGGAVKNVIALAAGIVDGLGLGLDTRAALITRGLAEITRLGVRLGANPHTFAGLAGVGDLILTCTGSLSRNHTVGKKIGEGKTPKEILSEMNMVVEGVKTAKSVYNFSKKLNVEMPISHEVYHILYDGANPGDALMRLMTRNLKQELDEQRNSP